MRRVDQPRPPGTPVGLREQTVSNADAPARNVPPAHPAPERPTGMLGGLTSYVPGGPSGRPPATPTTAETSRRPTTSTLPLPYGGHDSAPPTDQASGHPSRMPQLPQLTDIEHSRFHFVTTESQRLPPAPPRVPPTGGASPSRRSTALRPSPAELTELADTVQQYAGLETLTLAHYPLRSLPASIASLSRLRELSILECPELIELPEHLASTNASGEHEGLVNLQSLQLVQTGITSLPASITSLQNLKSLQIRNCPLSKLAAAIHQLPKLEEIDLEGCTALRFYPPINGGNAPLKRLNLKDCSNLLTLPLDIHNLTQLEELDLQGCNKLFRLPSSIAELPADCIIRGPEHLQAELDPLRTVALELNKVALERIEDTAYALLSTVIDEERNPFLEGAPSYLPEKRPPDTPTTFGQIPDLQKMLEESRDRHFLKRVSDMAGPSPRVEDGSEEGLSRHYTNVSNWKAQKSAHLGIVDHLGQFVYHQGSPIDAATLTKAVQMWKTRELIVNAHPQDRARFPAFTLHIPEQVSDDSEDEQQTSAEPSPHP
ncbi:hypothetical protein WAE31_18305 (plasmid) [Xanthomonas axonopodis pv. vasculorum]